MLWHKVQGAGGAGGGEATFFGPRGVFGGGFNVDYFDTIDYITIATTGNAADFGDLTVLRAILAACSDGTRGVFGGGTGWSVVLDYITIATTGNAADFGDLAVGKANPGACSDGTRGVFGGGGPKDGIVNIDYITIATTGNAADFGDLSVGRTGAAGLSGG